MAMSDDDKKIEKPVRNRDGGSQQEPEWATGLKRLYASVVDEPLPDNFKDLLSKLDENGGK